MHIPDGFLSTPVWVALDVASLSAVGYVARRAGSKLEESRVPLLGVMGAFVFAAQMINFPVGAGTSGHLVGGALLAIALGPKAAIVVMTAILVVQALVFQDGGILALGANIMNMALAGVPAGWLPYQLWGGGRFRSAAIVAAGTLSVLVSASLAVSELLISGVSMSSSVLSLSFALFLISALIEGFITLAVVKGIESINPLWIQKPATAAPAVRALAACSVVLAGVGVLFASGAPDGLEHLSEAIGIAERQYALLPTPVADYELEGVSSEWLRKAAAGLIGLALMFGLCRLLAKGIVNRRS
jgi:ABC-type Co2+ transport system, permease component